MAAMKDYVLKEYGSWSVLIVAYLAGLIAGRGIMPDVFPVFIALGILVNSKQAFTRWSRQTAEKEALAVLLTHIVVAAAILIYVFRDNTLTLLPLLVVPGAYLIVNKIAGEHHVVTELLGFALLSLAAPIAKFAVGGVLDLTLFAAVAVFFCAGVFKVRVQLRKRDVDRIVSLVYLYIAAMAYVVLKLPVIILLPLLDNVIFTIVLYQVKLKTTGWIEVGKSVLFLVLIAVYYG